MLANHLYNLIEQLSQESQSAWRIRKYIEDAADCKECVEFWQKLKLDKEQHIADLTEMIQEHIRMQASGITPKRSPSMNAGRPKPVEGRKTAMTR